MKEPPESYLPISRDSCILRVSRVLSSVPTGRFRFFTTSSFLLLVAIAMHLLQIAMHLLLSTHQPNQTVSLSRFGLNSHEKSSCLGQLADAGASAQDGGRTDENCAYITLAKWNSKHKRKANLGKKNDSK